MNKNYADKMLERALDRIQRYNTLDVKKDDLGLWLAAKLVINELSLREAEITRLLALIDRLGNRITKYANEEKNHALPSSLIY